MKANFHTHTYRCRHADGTEREYIERAIAAGFHTLGFSDHTPYLFEGNYYSHFRMRPEELEGYVETLKQLREEYKDQINIYIGLETEYYPARWKNYLSLIEGKGVDYLILGQHFAGVEQPGEVYCGSGNDDPERLKRYVDTVIEGAKTGLFSYIAHPDLIHFTGAEQLLEEELDRMVREVTALGLPLEINLLGLREGRSYPTERLLRLMKKHGAKAILGSDAHQSIYVYHEQTVRKAEELLAEYGIEQTEEIDLTRLSKQGI